jgi:hypothetical protein
MGLSRVGGSDRGMVMKKLIIALICGILLVPAAAWGQKWIEPHVDKSGTYVEGHWQTPEDLRQNRYSTPGRVNPYTGEFTPYQPRTTVPQPKPYNPTPMPTTPANPNPYYQQKHYQ